MTQPDQRLLHGIHIEEPVLRIYVSELEGLMEIDRLKA